MSDACSASEHNAAPHFIGYRSLKQGTSVLIRIYVNCAEEARYEFAVDVVFSGTEEPHLMGLDRLPSVRKFDRLIGALEECARRERKPRGSIFQSPENLLYFLSGIRNSRNFDLGSPK